MNRFLKTILIISGLFYASCIYSAEINLAVAANFTGAINKLVPDFEEQSGHKVNLSLGSTGKLYAQIINGAPFDVFLAADIKRPELLEQKGLAVSGTRFTYATGILVLWVPTNRTSRTVEDIVAGEGFKMVAITNPKLAPYGEAATSYLRKRGLWNIYQHRMVVGNNISQTYQFVESGGASAGFVALSQIFKLNRNDARQVYQVPQEMHQPLTQQAVILQRTEELAVARQFMDYLKSSTARKVIQNFGYR